MPVADYHTYCRMLERATTEKFVCLALAEQAMVERVKCVTTELRSAGMTEVKA